MKKRIGCLAAGVLLCLFLGGCGTDRALILNSGADAVRGASGEQDDADGSGGDASGQTAGENREEDEKVIYVYVCGAVKQPRVVMLPVGSRGYQAVEAAGGFAEDAAADAVNLAESLEDGERFFIPTLEEADRAEAEREAAESGLVNINKADAARLCTLPGIGETRAEAIIAYRESHGEFKAPEDIMNVPGIKEGAFEKIKDRITVR